MLTLRYQSNQRFSWQVNLTRKELKQDKFAVEVEHTVDYFAAHRKQAIRYGAIALAVILIVARRFYLPQFAEFGPAAGSGRSDYALERAGGRCRPGRRAELSHARPRKTTRSTRLSTKSLPITAVREEAYIAEYYLGASALDARQNG